MTPRPRGVRRRYCVRCETRTVRPTTLGFIARDGTVGDVAGFACSRCHEFWEVPDAPPVVTARVDLEGLDPWTWIMRHLHQLGCNPQPQP